MLQQRVEEEDAERSHIQQIIDVLSFMLSVLNFSLLDIAGMCECVFFGFLEELLVKLKADFFFLLIL